MTSRERFIKTLLCEEIGGQVPTFELAFYLTMEAFGKVHPCQRDFSQWNQMSSREKRLHIEDMAQIYIDSAVRYGHSAIKIHGCPGGYETMKYVAEAIREKSDDDYYLTMHGDPTLCIPNGDEMMEFSVNMYEAPEKLHEQSKRQMDACLEFSAKLAADGHPVDGITMCSDYCFNTNPFFDEEMFAEFVQPYLRETISEFKKMGYYVIKHTDGNVMPILKMIADCKPHGIHSLDPQAEVSLTEARKIVGPDIALVGNVNCGLLQTGTDEECRADILRSLREGMANKRGYIFCTSNTVYTGMPLERYEMMIDLWRKYGNYDTASL